MSSSCSIRRLDASAFSFYQIDMAIRDIITVPDKRLKQVSAPVVTCDDDTRLLMDDMLASMYAAHGIGLAAIQIGIPNRIVVMDLTSQGANDRYLLEDNLPNIFPHYFVNPEIIWTSDETRVYAEGCLSVPEFYDDVERPSKCRITYLDYHGSPQELACEGLLATCIQHEIDHLNGIVFLDHLSRLKRERAIRVLKKHAPRLSSPSPAAM